MTKFRVKAGLLFLSLVIVFTGCKKDDAAQSFTVDVTGLHFLYGQVKEVGYSFKNIGTIEVTEVPDGWLCELSGGKIVITAPSSASTGEQSGDVKVAGTGTSTLTRTIAVAIKPAQEIASPPANCIIVTDPDTRYKFNASRIGNQTSASITPDDAVLVWCTSKEAISHVSLEDGYIFFATEESESLAEANALIAAVDADGNVLWSWHIWATDYDPAANAHQFQGMAVMDRNLGAYTLSNASTDDVLRSYGLYYQWGRKDPFVGANPWNSTTQQSIYNATGRWLSITFELTDSEKGTIEYATANPLTYVVGIEETEYDWLHESRNHDLWGGVSGTKSIYDPCPAGWKVAPSAIWASFTSTGQASEDPDQFEVAGPYEYGWTFFDTNDTPVYYPAAGRRSFSKETNNFTNVIDPGFGETGSPVGFYWSNTAISANESAVLAFTENYINPGTAYFSSLDEEDGAHSAEGARAGGFPLRCIAE